MTTPNIRADFSASAENTTTDLATNRALSVLRRLVKGERVSVLSGLDDFLLRDIGASGDDIWRVHRLRNGQRPTLLVG
jgi:hypothetical protein